LDDLASHQKGAYSKALADAMFWVFRVLLMTKRAMIVVMTASATAGQIMIAGQQPGTAVWSHDGLFCTGETYKNVVKMTFSGAPPWMTPQVSSILVVIGRQTDAKTRNRRWYRSAIQTPFKTKRGVFGGPIAPVLKPSSPDKRGEI